MNKRFQPNQHIFVPGLVYSLAIVFLLCTHSEAQPPPDWIPSGDTHNIDIFTDSTNDTLNQGNLVIGLSGTFNLWAPHTLYNDTTGLIDVFGKFYINSTTDNSSRIIVEDSGVLEISDTLNNLSSAEIFNSNYTINYWIFNNDGSLNNGATFISFWEINNSPTGTINTSGLFESFRMINGGVFNANAGDTAFFGLTNNDPGGIINIRDGARLENHDILNNKSGASLNVDGGLDAMPGSSFFSEGDTRVGATGTFRVGGSADFLSGSTTNVDGELNLLDGGALWTEPGSDFRVSGSGRLTSEPGSDILLGGRSEFDAGSDTLVGERLISEGDFFGDGDLDVLNGGEATFRGPTSFGPNARLNVNPNAVLNIDSPTFETAPGSTLNSWGKLEVGPTTFTELNGENNLGPGHVLSNNGVLDFGSGNTIVEGGETTNNGYVGFNGPALIRDEALNNNFSINVGPLSEVTIENSTIQGPGDWVVEGGLDLGQSTNAEISSPFGFSILGGSLGVGTNSTAHLLPGAPLNAFSSNVNVEETGNLLVDDSAEFRFGTTVNTKGSIGIGGTGSIELESSTFNALAGSKTTNDNLVHLGPSAIFNLNEGAEYINNNLTIVDESAQFNFLGGNYKGSGEHVGDVPLLVGTMAPGESAGTLTIDGDFTLDDFGILDIEIGGFTPGTFDLLDIKGKAYLPGGNINLSFLDGYDIAADIGPGERWELSFLTAGSIDSFGSLITYNFTGLPYFQFDVLWQGNELVFEATNAVPVPPAVLLGGIGLAVAGWKLRKRKES